MFYNDALKEENDCNFIVEAFITPHVMNIYTILSSTWKLQRNSSLLHTRILPFKCPFKPKSRKPTLNNVKLKKEL